MILELSADCSTLHGGLLGYRPGSEMLVTATVMAEALK